MMIGENVKKSRLTFVDLFSGADITKGFNWLGYKASAEYGLV
jgi:hypothetical protein